MIKILLALYITARNAESGKVNRFLFSGQLKTPITTTISNDAAFCYVYSALQIEWKFSYGLHRCCISIYQCTLNIVYKGIMIRIDIIS